MPRTRVREACLLLSSSSLHFALADTSFLLSSLLSLSHVSHNPCYKIHVVPIYYVELLCQKIPPRFQPARRKRSLTRVLGGRQHQLIIHDLRPEPVNHVIKSRTQPTVESRTFSSLNQTRRRTILRVPIKAESKIRLERRLNLNHFKRRVLLRSRSTEQPIQPSLHTRRWTEGTHTSLKETRPTADIHQHFPTNIELVGESATGRAADGEQATYPEKTVVFSGTFPQKGAV
ncbi:hypothetical protein K402DRAFT_28157 [Aulographum hederae CBS 113979]|uniref:Uncharacterized protein n=1 Tax=Aulographum hederae CBS 113979 TaxID=1176131 RepID=A0A6G1H5Y3_9PEZI|nr:hypothetical protein K402DRAFT_28157 [Aulographum hederae CBS 113979]